MLGWMDLVAREVMLFAAVGLLIGGVDDLLVDVLFLLRRLWDREPRRRSLAGLPAPTRPGRMAVFVPAWDEEAVIGRMLATAVDRYDHPDYRIYVGVYPNDQATRDAVAAVAQDDVRVRLVVGTKPGPTTKADCLNTLWRALLVDDAREGRETLAVALHDAEDVVHASELRVFDSLLQDHDVVQLPVQPLIHRDARMVSAHYADEFAEQHGKTLVVRTALGAGMPLAGTGCAIRTDMLRRIADQRGGDPFDERSLVEDYELGLRIAALGGRGVFARVSDGGSLVAVRSYFPGTLGAAVRQKARWMTGIALAGWDRTGWAPRPLAFGDHWMRMRDRRAPLAMLVLAAAYLAMLLWGASATLHHVTGAPPPGSDPLLDKLLLTGMFLLGWRLVMRVAFTARLYGPVEAFLSVPRFLVGNYVALAAAPKALAAYLRLLGGAPTVWDKTRHDFPDLAEAAAR